MGYVPPALVSIRCWASPEDWGSRKDAKIAKGQLGSRGMWKNGREEGEEKRLTAEYAEYAEGGGRAIKREKRRDQPRNTRNTRKENTGRYSDPFVRVFSVFRG